MKIHIIASGSLLGTTLLNFFYSLPSFSFVISFVILSIAFFLLGQRTLKQTLFCSLNVGLLAICMGFAWAYFHAYQRLASQIPLEDCYRIITITGIVKGMTKSDRRDIRFDIVVSQLEDQKFNFINKPKFRLHWRNTQYSLIEGDKLTLKVKLKLPWRLANPGVYDTEKQYFKEGIDASGSVIECMHYESNNKWTIARIRQSIFESLAKRYEDMPLLPIIQATTLGVYGKMTSEQFAVFSATGTLHAIAISGSHIAMVSWFFTILVTTLTRQSVRLTTIYPAQYWGAMAGMLSAMGYAALAGWGIPTQRALIMIMVAFIALLQGKKILTWDLLAIAWLAIGCWDPLSVLDTGFWLSFGCVAVLIGTQALTVGAWWRRWILPQWFIFVGMIPFSTVFFHQIAIISPIANMFTLPLIGFFVVPLSLFGVLSLKIYAPFADHIIFIAHGFLTLAWRILEFLATIPVCLTVLTPTPPSQGDYRVTLLDVGQGLSVVIQTAEHVLLFDTGPSYGKHTNAGDLVVKPFLKRQNIHQIDTLIISHADDDHRGGWMSLKDFPIKTIYSSEPQKISPKALLCESRKTWEWEGVIFTLLATQNGSSRNDHSCVLKIHNKQHSVLITGDIEKKAEAELIQRWPHLLRSDILVVPHHGSLSSSTPQFISRVSPQYALYAVGFHNKYRFPDSKILSRYEKIGAKNILTAEKGAIIFDLRSEQELTLPQYWREIQHRYWHRQQKQGI